MKSSFFESLVKIYFSCIMLSEKGAELMNLENSIMVSDGHICTPVVYLSRGERKVTLVGACHLGLISYYEHIQSLLDSHEEQGFVVTFEGVDWSDMSRFLALFGYDDEESRLLDNRFTELLKSEFGFSGQVKIITPRKSWIFTDSLFTPIAADYPRSDNASIAKTIEVVAANPKAFFEKFRDGIIATIEGGSLSSPLSKLEERNNEAMSAIMQLSIERDVVSCWGANHLVGMVRMLLVEGFEIISIEWLPFLPISLPDNKSPTQV